MEKSDTSKPDADADQSARGHVEKFVVSARKKLGLDSSFMHENYLRVTSSMRIGAEVLTILSGQKFKTGERSVAGSVGIVSNLLGVVFKQKPQVAEELDKIGDMSTGEYVALRHKQALHPHEHIRQTLALNMMAGSVMGMLASAKSGRIGEGLSAAVGFAAACVLDFTKDEQKAWQRHSTIMGTTVVPIQIGYGFEAGLKKGDRYIPGAMALQAGAHGLTFLETYGRKKDTGADDKER